MKLKPCPFCGKEKTVVLVSNGTFSKSVLCNYDKGGCGAVGGRRSTMESAAENWNTRFGVAGLEQDAEFLDMLKENGLAEWDGFMKVVNKYMALEESRLMKSILPLKKDGERS